MEPTDPWPEFLEKYCYSLMRNLVAYQGGVSGEYYVRVEGKLRHFVAVRERQLKRAVLEDLLERWQQSSHQGVSLEATLKQVLDELSDSDSDSSMALPDDLLMVQDETPPVESGERPSYRPQQPEETGPASDLPASGFRVRGSREETG